MTLPQAGRILGSTPDIIQRIDLRLMFASAYVFGYPRSTNNLIIGKGRTTEAAIEDLVAKHYEWLRRTIYAEQDGRCNFCGDRMAVAELDHIELRSHGRSDIRSNCRLLCNRCHQLRHRPKAIPVMSTSPDSANEIRIHADRKAGRKEKQLKAGSP